MIRVVLDNNVLVSAVLSPYGSPARLFLMAITEPDIRLYVSAEVLAEYEEVIRRPKLRRSEVEIESMLRTVREKFVWVRPFTKVHACSDPDDDIFLDCAVAADAHFLVTGNTKDLPFSWGATKVVTARTFLDTVA